MKAQILLALITLSLFSYFIPCFCSADSIRVGVFYYVWYEGSKHSNVVDEPIIGWENYWSNSSKTINWHLKWFKELDIDFVIISWWGPNNFIDNATKTVFKTFKEQSAQIQIAIMIEPFNESGTYNYTELYNYIYETYVSSYPEIYMRLYGRPLLCLYNGQNLTKDGKIPSDNRFEIRIVGHEAYANWLYSRSYEMKSWENELAMDGQISVMPRYDDTHFRSPGAQKDPTYKEGYYDEQWSKVLKLAREGKVNYVTIASWNEFAERTQIEPCWDETSYKKNDPFYIFNKTKDYIKQLKGTMPQPIRPEVIAAIAVATAGMSGLLRVVVRRR